MAELEDLGFCKYDREVKIVWVVKMWRYQIGDPIKPQDKKLKGILTHLQGLPTTSLVDEFMIHAGLKPLAQAPSTSPFGRGISVSGCPPIPSHPDPHDDSGAGLTGFAEQGGGVE
jgi:hypothetical protein